eukprot:6197331-Pleurochrysis_carterae.AAC.2
MAPKLLSAGSLLAHSFLPLHAQPMSLSPTRAHRRGLKGAVKWPFSGRAAQLGRPLQERLQARSTLCLRPPASGKKSIKWRRANCASQIEEPASSMRLAELKSKCTQLEEEARARAC